MKKPLPPHTLLISISYSSHTPKNKTTHRAPQRYLKKIYQIPPTPHPEIPPQAEVIYQIYQISRSRRMFSFPI